MIERAAGWYPHTEMAQTLRYWDGAAWTDHIAPAPPAPVAPVDVEEPAPPSGRGVPVVEPEATRPCPYNCGETIARTAYRCRGCGGELQHCPSCGERVGLRKKEKFVGLLRGGTKTQSNCMKCGKVLDGPRL